VNYIASLKSDLAATRAQLDQVVELAREFRTHLASDKFTGFDHEGSRRDWIATRDVDGRLLAILSAASEG
jgi:hypothetical protein